MILLNIDLKTLIEIGLTFKMLIRFVTDDILKLILLASVAQLDARPAGDQKVAGWTPTRSATFFCGDLIMKYFLWSFSPFC